MRKYRKTNHSQLLIQLIYNKKNFNKIKKDFPQIITINELLIKLKSEITNEDKLINFNNKPHTLKFNFISNKRSTTESIGTITK